MPDPMTLDEALSALHEQSHGNQSLTQEECGAICDMLCDKTAEIEAQAAEIEQLKANADECEAELAQRHEEVRAECDANYRAVLDVRNRSLKHQAARIAELEAKVERVSRDALAYVTKELNASADGWEARIAEIEQAHCAELERGDFEGWAVCSDGAIEALEDEESMARALADSMCDSFEDPKAFTARRFVARFVEEG